MRKYVGSFKSIQNVVYRVELWDDPSGTTPEITARLYAARVLAAGGYQEGASCMLTKLQSLNSSTELKLAGNGFSIERQGEGDSVYSDFVRPSRASAQWVMPDQTTLDDFIAIQTQAETAWAMIIYRDDVMWYVGRVLADQMTRLRESIQSKPIIDYLTQIRKLENYLVFDVAFPMTWKILKRHIIEDKFVNNGTANDLLNLSFVSEYDEKNINLIQENILNIINYNLEREEKERLFQYKRSLDVYLMYDQYG